MLHTTFGENQPADSEEDFLKGFYHTLNKIPNATGNIFDISQN